MKRSITIVLLLLCIALFIYAIVADSITVFSLSGKPEKKITSSELVEITTYDGLMLKDNKLYDIYSLTPELLQVKDCAT